LLDQFALEDVADTLAEKLPHGDRKLLDVAISFALDPNYLLLDEPTSGRRRFRATASATSRRIGSCSPA